MKIYLISIDDYGYDEYRSAVVIAENEQEARYIHPDEYSIWDSVECQWFYIIDDVKLYHGVYHSWTDHPDNVKVTYIGEAPSYATKSVVLTAP